MLLRPLRSRSFSLLSFGLVSACLSLSAEASPSMTVLIQSAIQKEIVIRQNSTDTTITVSPSCQILLDAEQVDGLNITEPSICYISSLTKTDLFPLPQKPGVIFLAVSICLTIVLCSLRFVS